MNKNNILDQIRERYPEFVVNDKKKAYELSRWLEGAVIENDSLGEELWKYSMDYEVILDSPDWVAEVMDIQTSDKDLDIPRSLVFIRYKHGELCNIRSFYGPESTLENISKFLENPKKLEESKKYEMYYQEMGKPKRFDGTIVITDPCYTVESWDDNDQDVDIFSGFGFEKVYGDTYIYGSTIYGDWSCTVYNCGSLDPKNIIDEFEKTHTVPSGLPIIGEFCADSGLVCVIYLDKSEKIKRYSEYCRTIVPDFHGTVQYYRKNNVIYIVGTSDDNKNNFVSFQTGL